MAVLTDDETTVIRQSLAQGETPNWTKAQINAAAQAVEDILVGATLQTAISNAINTATSPVVLTATQKRRLVAFVLERKYRRDR